MGRAPAGVDRIEGRERRPGHGAGHPSPNGRYRMFALWTPWRGPAWASSTRRCCAKSTAKTRQYSSQMRRGHMTQHHEDALSEERRREVGTEAAEHILGPNPVVGVRGQDLFQTASMLVKQAVKQPHLVLAHGLTFAAEAARIVGGSSRLAPDAKDRRF